MVSQIITGAVVGIDGYKIIAEVDMNNSLPGMTIVGLPDMAVSEAKERIRSAIKNSGYSVPVKKIIINLAPADIKKEGSGFDLPMAIGVLAASGEISEKELENTAFLGELSLDGGLRSV
ncbi:MAG: magnesium chelatase domain-containing protein, partial [Candidatus Gastranaerophilaceae bacterium]